MQPPSGGSAEEIRELSKFFRDLGIEAENKRVVLAAACFNSAVTYAARNGGVSLPTLLMWLGRAGERRAQYKDEDFIEAYAVAHEACVANLEEEAARRARAGTEDRSSGDLLKFLLRANKDKYQERRHHNVDAPGGVLQTEIRLHQGKD